MSKKNESHRPRLERVVVTGELRGEPDWDRFAWALLQHVRLTNRAAEAEAAERGEREAA
jgi:hypothetical protein